MHGEKTLPVTRQKTEKPGKINNTESPENVVRQIAGLNKSEKRNFFEFTLPRACVPKLLGTREYPYIISGNHRSTFSFYCKAQEIVQSRSGGCGWGIIIKSSVRHLEIMETDVTRSTYKISLNDLSL